jgi:hypothetical protein
LVLRGEGGITVFMNRVLRKISGSKGVEMTGEWCILFASYCSGDEIKQNEMGGACGTYWENRIAYRVLMGKTKGRGPLGRRRGRWEDNIKIPI